VPILHSAMTGEILRYIKEDRILKVPFESDMREALESLKYPYLRLKYHNEEYFELCSNSSCFAKAISLKAIESAVTLSQL